MVSGHADQPDLPPTFPDPGSDTFSNSRVTIMVQTQTFKNFLVPHIMNKKYVFGLADRQHRLLNMDLHRPHTQWAFIIKLTV